MALRFRKYDDIVSYFDRLHRFYATVDLKLAFAKLRDMFALQPFGFSGYLKIGQRLTYFRQVSLFFGKNLEKTGRLTPFPQLLFEYRNYPGVSNLDFFNSVRDSFPESCQVLVDRRNVDRQHLYHVLVDGVNPAELFDQFHLSVLSQGYINDIVHVDKETPLKILYTFPNPEALFNVFEAIEEQITLNAALMEMHSKEPVELHLSFQKTDSFAIDLVDTPIEQKKHIRLIARVMQENKTSSFTKSLNDHRLTPSRGLVIPSELNGDGAAFYDEEGSVEEKSSFGGRRRSTLPKVPKRVPKTKAGGRRKSRSRSKQSRQI